MCRLLVLFLFYNFFANSQIFFENSLDEAFDKSEKTKKLVFIKMYSENCSHCKKLQEILDIDSISKYINNNFICYKMESENTPEYDLNFLSKSKIYIENIPVLLFFDDKRNFLHYGQPKQESEFVIKTFKTAYDPVERTSNLKNLYESGKRDNVTLKRYSKLAQLQHQTKIVNQLAIDIFNNFPKEEMLSMKSIGNCASYVKSIENPFFTFWMDNYEKLVVIAPETKLEDKQKVFKDILSENINQNKEKWNLEQIKNAKNYIEITKLHRNANVFLWIEETNLLFKANKETEAIEILKNLYSTEKENGSLMLYVAQHFHQNLKNNESKIVFQNLVKKILNETKYEADLIQKFNNLL